MFLSNFYLKQRTIFYKTIFDDCIEIYKKKSDWSQLLPDVRRKFTCKQIVKSMHADRIKYKDKDMWYDC